MAATQNTGDLTCYLNGEPVNGIYRLDTGGLTYYLNGEPLNTIFPVATKSLGQFFLMF